MAITRTLTDAHRSFLERTHHGIVTTVRPDGSLHSTVVWVDVDEQGVSFNTEAGRTKTRNLEQNPQVSLLVIDEDDPYRWLAVRGTVEMTTDGGRDQIDRLAKKYTGADRFAGHTEKERIVVRIRPQTIEAIGFE
jgi:PPOX class probable F420-dependent enzyme